MTRPAVANAPDPSHYFSPAKKRHASGPITDGELLNGEPVESPALKRRRSNLANGFSTLSISARERQGFSPLPTYQESQELASDKEVDEDDVPGSSAYQDVRVEFLPDSPKSRRRGIRRPVYGSSSTSEASGSSSPDSESTYILPAGPSRYSGAPQMPDSVEEPGPAPTDTLVMEDVSDWRSRKRRHDDDDQQRKRRRNDGMDVDMDGTSADGDEAMDELGGDYNRGRRKERGWYEPEKDREYTTSPTVLTLQVSWSLLSRRRETPQSTPKDQTSRSTLHSQDCRASPSHPHCLLGSWPSTGIASTRIYPQKRLLSLTSRSFHLVPTGTRLFACGGEASPERTRRYPIPGASRR